MVLNMLEQDACIYAKNVARKHFIPIIKSRKRGRMKIKAWINWIRNYERFCEIMRLYKQGSIDKKMAFDLMRSAFDIE